MECHKRVGNQKMCPLLLRKLCKKCRTQNYSISYKYNLIELSQAQAMYGFHDH